jgi:hypothetical protein
MAAGTTLGALAKAVKRTLGVEHVGMVKALKSPGHPGEYRLSEDQTDRLQHRRWASGLEKETFSAVKVRTPVRFPWGGRADAQVPNFSRYARGTMDSKLDLDVGMVESCRQAAAQIASQIAA